MISQEDLMTAIDRLGLAGRPVMAHFSLRSFGRPVEGGADAVIEVFLQRGCTLLVPAFTEPHFLTRPPGHLQPGRNGIDYADVLPGPLEGARPYTPCCGLINPKLGVFPARVLERADMLRNEHPLNSFAAVGPLAGSLVRDPATDLYGPVRALRELNGAVLLAGVGLNRMTALHEAERVAGRRSFLRWAYRPDGEVGGYEIGSCSDGFPRLAPPLDGLRTREFVGDSAWDAYDAEPVVETAARAITADPEITRCSDSSCRLCADAVRGGPTGSYSLG